MSKQKFHLSEWQRNAALTLCDEVEIVTSRIELTGMDIAPTYNDWRDLGFALAQGLGEEGRAFYHRLSRFYSSYQPAETEKQYTACLRSGGRGITVNTFSTWHGKREWTSIPGYCQIAKMPNCRKRIRWHRATENCLRPMPNSRSFRMRYMLRCPVCWMMSALTASRPKTAICSCWGLSLSFPLA